MFKPKAGTYLLDILPYAAGKGNPWADEGALHWERTYYIHRDVGANGEWKVCPRMTSKKPCPICDARAKLMKKGDADEDLIKSLAPKQRQLFNVINLKEPDKGVQLWDFSYHCFGKALDAELRNADEDDGWEKFFFLEDGFTLKVVFGENSAGGYSYLDAESIHFKPRKEDYGEDILESVHCLDDLLILNSYEDLKKDFLEADEDEDEDEEDEDTKPKARGTKPKSSDDEDEDEEEEDAEDSDEDEEDEKPTKKSKKSKDDEDEEDEFEDFDDSEDEDEKPAKKKKSKDDEDEEKEEEPEDEEEPDDEDEDEEDEDEKPKKQFGKSKGDKGWDTDDEDEDEEDEKPAKKGKRK